MTPTAPSFNLWTEPWIALERPNGDLIRLGIADTLSRAHEWLTLYDLSPLAIVGVHRLLVAILQDTLNPQSESDLDSLWRAGCFPAEKLAAFGRKYAHRYNLFSPDEPFLQSGDLPLYPSKRDKDLKTITYLMQEIPAGNEVTHYRHGVADDNIFCPACVARGLVMIPAFATSGGAGIKPSINGVPPIYVLPGGDTLFESLTASLVLPENQPEARSTGEDAAWWRHAPVVSYKAIAHEVGYVHSLTFPARRVRLHPEPLNGTCTCCGGPNPWGVRTMVYQMGESRPDDAPFWRDPFAAYRVHGEEEPIPIRPQEGKALWREFAAMFLTSNRKEKEHTMPPTALYQRAELAEEGIGPKYRGMFPCRCIGVRTDMKAKIFEWLDAGFDVPISLINDAAGSLEVQRGLQFAAECARSIAGTFHEVFGGKGKIERHTTLRRQMGNDYWSTLAIPFRDFALGIAAPATRETASVAWVERAVTEARQAFKVASEAIGNDAASLRERVEGQNLCRARLYGIRKKRLEP
jgi:CRISPR system Cascade subunit CasA